MAKTPEDEPSSKPRVTVCLRADGSFEILINDAGRDLLVAELQRLDRRWDHFHLDYFSDPEIADATDIQLSAIAYHSDDKVLENGKIVFRPDDWDNTYYPHVMAPLPTPQTPDQDERN